MKCHYEVLSLERDASEADIKTAYRKLALRWHPDKNLDNPEAAKVQFQLVQQAYEVLSDPQERAWYDRHRDQILKGGNTNYEDDSLDVFQYFTTTCYKGYDDGDESFYAVYAEVFDKIASEDIEYMDNPEEFEEIPKFGNSKSSYEAVVGRFYAYWEAYSTKKSYAWLCPHNISEIRDRRILREIEKESKKIQQKARKERNEEIRSLVSFVRKRDRRVIAYKKLLEEKAEKNRLKTQQIRLEQMRKRNAELEEQRKSLAKSAVNDDYEEKLRQLESNLYGSSDDDDDDYLSDTEELSTQLADADLKDEPDSVGEDAELLDQLYCVACDKEFKSVSAFSNHESSKKHKQNVDALKQEMLDEESNVSTEVNDQHTNGEKEEDDEEESEEEQEVIAKSKGKKSAKKQKKLAKVTSYESADSADDQEKTDEVLNGLLGNTTDEVTKTDDWEDIKKPGKKPKAPKGNKAPNAAKPPPPVPIEEPEKVAKKSAKAKPKPEKPKKYDPDAEENPIDTDQVCVTCKQQFDSKNKLFSHLKKTGHGVYIAKPEEYVVEKKGKKRR